MNSFDINNENEPRSVALNNDTASNSSQSRPNLTACQRTAIYEHILKQSVDGKPRHGSKKDIAATFGVNPVTITRIWKRSRASLADGAICADVSSKKKGKYKFLECITCPSTKI